jgi:signal transduction histidine kinase
VNAILNAQKGTEDVRECRITQRNGSSLDLRVWASPLDVGGEHLTVFTVMDISHEKRRRALEQIFFHDILNTTCSLKSNAYLMQGASQEETDELIKKVVLITDVLNDEITAQRTLANAENGELAVLISDCESQDVLLQIVKVYSNIEQNNFHTITLSPNSANLALSTDRVLLKRVIGNMIKNALEACRRDDTVTIGCTPAGSEVKFWVHNPGAMPREVQLQVFQRSFSTKGAGRGLGTYSIKLLTERYLKGSVSFSTSAEEGTTFSITIPAILE